MALQSLLALLKNLVIFSSYVSEKSSFPQPLSKEKEKEYIQKSLDGDKEAKEILAVCRGYVVALAVEGKKLSSEGFASFLKKKADEGAELTFVIGSSCGLSPAVKQAADCLLSFSDFTFPHQLMRVILCEQTYRAFMINSGSVYHK